MNDRKQHFDYFIVGQGLAGSALAMQLVSLGKKVLVIDAPDKNCCSVVAAGLFNPITEGRMMKKTWIADLLFESLHNFYTEAERLTGHHFFFPMPLYRPFDSVEEQNEWMARSVDEYYRPFIDRVFTQEQSKGLLNDPYGGLLLKQSGFLNTRRFLGAVASWLSSKGFLLNTFFEERLLQIEDKEVAFGGLTADRIVFCQGIFTRDSKLFGWVPVTPLKGETFTIKVSLPENMIINRGVYLVPEGSGLWKAGATYFYRDTDPGNSADGREELEKKISDLLCIEYEVMKLEWGIRPASPDRRPILGVHPAYPRVFIFNGLGTKGVSLAPHFSKVFASCLENNAPLNEEVNIERYKSVYSRSARL